jgi:small glutamine-rich tetratricopeptide repeat-containing protein alpha
VAQQCIADSFDVDMNDEAAMKDALGGQNLLSIYGVYEKLKGKSTATPATPAPGSTSAPRTATPATAAAGAAPSAEQKLEAENLKGQGNTAMQKKDYPTAIDLYGQALKIDSKNPIYLSNRAAAYSASSKHMEAAVDAEVAVAADPKYTKAWSRLGLARFALGDAKGSMEAYKKGIDFEGNGGSPAMKRGYETAKKRVEDEEASGITEDDVGASPRGPAAGAGGMPDLSGLTSMLGGGGGGGGPDLGALLNNPMFANMAQNLMSNPDMMSNIMNNPQLRQMADQFGGGGAGGQGDEAGGRPDISSLLQDPSIAEMSVISGFHYSTY